MPPRKATRNYRRTTGRTTKRYTSRTHRTGRMSMTTYACSSPRFKTVRDECQWRMGSYRNVFSQFTPAGTKTVFSPSAANKWTRYVNSGVRVYKYNSQQFSRYFGAKWAHYSPTTIKNYLRKKYGVAVKDVIRGKGNCWLVATTKSITGRPFNNYNWK